MINTRRHFCKTSITTMALMPWPQFAAAHRVPLTVTTMTRNGDILSIAHRLHAHDAVKLLEGMENVSRPDITILKNQARIALHMANAFLLKDPVKPDEYKAKVIGAELEGNYFFIYQEFDLSLMNAKPISTLVVKSTALKSIGQNWLHHVNIDASNANKDMALQSLTFSDTPKWQEVYL